MKISAKELGIAAIVLILLEVAILFGFTGLRTVAGILIFFTLPVYLILDNFKLNRIEKVFFSIFIGFGLYPTSVWYVNRIIPSLTLSIFITSIILVGIGLLLKRYLKKNIVEEKKV
jgi:hypothetical protein